MELVTDDEVTDFLQLIFYDTLSEVFKVICRVENLDHGQQEELRRLVLRPNDIRIAYR
jgi:hypothetical protein